MEKFILFAALCVLCAPDANAADASAIVLATNNLPQTTNPVPEILSAKDVPEGLRIKMCQFCHQENHVRTDDPTYTGPSFQKIALKYKDDPAAIDIMAKKISKGTRGDWSTDKIMPPLDPALKHQEIIRALAKYILAAR